MQIIFIHIILTLFLIIFVKKIFMKIILSRKGFDSKFGGMASPILPDGTLLSLPIPSNDDVKFSELKWSKKNYLDLIQELNPKSSLNTLSTCHLDPDLRRSTIPRLDGWTSAFGQTGSALSELRKHNISIGDIFLFFGWFKNTEFINGKLKYHGKDLHVIYGYLQVGEIIESQLNIPNHLIHHPHANEEKYKNAWNNKSNAIFIPSNNLSLNPNLAGSGTFKFNQKLVLTKDGYSRSRWEFPQEMYGIPISHNPNGWKENYFQSAAIGQEFVIEGLPPVIDWVKSIFKSSKIDF